MGILKREKRNHRRDAECAEIIKHVFKFISAVLDCDGYINTNTKTRTFTCA